LGNGLVWNLKEVRYLIQVNLTAVAVASAVSMGVGFAWYSNAMFGKQWIKANNLNGPKISKNEMIKTFGITFVVTLVSAYILSLFIHYAGAYTLLNGAKTGLWAWIGFVVPTTLANALFLRRSMPAYLIEAGHHLVGLLVMGAILASWY